MTGGFVMPDEANSHYTGFSVQFPLYRYHLKSIGGKSKVGITSDVGVLVCFAGCFHYTDIPLFLKDVKHLRLKTIRTVGDVN